MGGGGVILVPDSQNFCRLSLVGGGYEKALALGVVEGGGALVHIRRDQTSPYTLLAGRPRRTGRISWKHVPASPREGGGGDGWNSKWVGVPSICARKILFPT